MYFVLWKKVLTFSLLARISGMFVRYLRTLKKKVEFSDYCNIIMSISNEHELTIPDVDRLLL